MRTDPRVARAMELIYTYADEAMALGKAPSRGPILEEALDARETAARAVEAHVTSMAAEISRLTAELEEARKGGGPIAKVVDNTHFHDHWRLQVLGITVAGSSGTDARREFQRLAGQINMAADRAAAMTKEKPHGSL